MTTSIPRINPTTSLLIIPEPLLPSTFSPFGTAILPPLPTHLTTVPHTPPRPLHPQQPAIQPANQKTALKTSPISPLVNTYPTRPPTRNETEIDTTPESKGQMSIFSCFPRRNTYLDPKTGKLRLCVDILERHPYTTQTFCPFNFSSATHSHSHSQPGSPTSTSTPTYFLIVVAPTKRDPTTSPSNPPDLSRLRAFVAPVTVDGGVGVAVTYAAGTWHAPMVVVGGRRVDFLVAQFVNGVPGDDCQEVLVGMGEGDKEGVRVEVDLKGLGLGTGSEVEDGLWRAKL